MSIQEAGIDRGLRSLRLDPSFSDPLRSVQSLPAPRLVDLNLIRHPCCSYGPLSQVNSVENVWEMPPTSYQHPRPDDQTGRLHPNRPIHRQPCSQNPLVHPAAPHCRPLRRLKMNHREQNIESGLGHPQTTPDPLFNDALQRVRMVSRMSSHKAVPRDVVWMKTR